MREGGTASPLSAWDIAMAEQAFTENKWRFWRSYNGNTRLRIIGSYSCSDTIHWNVQ